MDWASASKIADAVSSRRMSAIDVINGALSRIAAHDSRLNSFTDVISARARATAGRVDATITAGGKVGNPTKVTTKAKKNKVTVKAKKTFKLAAKQAGKKIKKHRAVSYESSNPAVATVTTKGVIKGVKKGKCKIYAYAQNGVFATVSVKVK